MVYIKRTTQYVPWSKGCVFDFICFMVLQTQKGFVSIRRWMIAMNNGLRSPAQE
jgi:hypothetical protein